MTSTLADILTLQRYAATEAWSGQEALEKARSTAFDCVLTDVRMPDMKGAELHKALMEVKPGLPVILMTTFASDELLRQGMQQFVAGTLDKPLDINLLLVFFSALPKNLSVAIVDDDPVFCQTLADIRLPGRNGLGSAKRADDQCAYLPV